MMEPKETVEVSCDECGRSSFYRIGRELCGVVDFKCSCRGCEGRSRRMVARRRTKPTIEQRSTLGADRIRAVSLRGRPSAMEIESC